VMHAVGLAVTTLAWMRRHVKGMILIGCIRRKIEGRKVVIGLLMVLQMENARKLD